MKKLLHVSLLVIAMLCLGYSPAKALDFVDGYAQINTATDLVDFSKMVRNGNYSINGVLNADIDLSGVKWDPIGTASGAYRGTFDGKGHRIKNLILETSDSYIGLFGRITGGANIKNLIIDSTCSFAGDSYIGGIAGAATGSGVIYITNCGNEAKVVCTTRNAAGIVGSNIGNGCQYIFTNLYNAGAIEGPAESAAITGWEGYYNSRLSQFTNIVNLGTVTGYDDTRNMYRAPSYVNAKNVYDIMGIQGTPIDDTEAASGALTYLLNNYSTTDVAWYQNIEGDNAEMYPTLDATHGVVYPVGNVTCSGKAEGEITYSNTNQTVRAEHAYADGICSVCGTLEDGFVPFNDSVYEISTAAQLNWFAKKVNNGDYTANAKLMADIDFSEYTALDVRIGCGDACYSGVFDGQAHTVTVEYDMVNTEFAALFGSLSNGTVRNLITTGSITTDYRCAGGIFGNTYGASLVENCISNVEITTTLEGDGTTGGLGGFSYGTTTIRNCAFFGTITGDKTEYNGGLVGYTGGADIKIANCLYAGTANVGANSGLITRGGATISNTYYIEAGSLDPELSTNVNAIQTDIEQIGTGELCYLLNNSQSDSVYWYQNIDAEGVDPDEYPTPFATSAKVYLVGTLNCDGTAGEDKAYSNTNSSTILPHEYEAGVCSFCHNVDEDYFAPAEDGVYEISTPEQLRWFAYAVNAGKETADARLLNDIDFSTYTLAEDLMIGCSAHAYKGTFDGQGHTVNVKYESQDGYQALFQRVYTATIQNLRTTGTITGGYLCAGIASRVSTTCTFNNCVSAVDITANVNGGDASAGGITGNSYGTTTYTNCAFVGSITSDGTGCAGIASYANGGANIVMQNCYVAATFNLNYEIDSVSNMFARNNPSLLNCYYIDNENLNIPTGQTIVTDAEVASGALCYLLNDKVSGDSTWTQTIGTDNYPLPFGGHGLVYATGEVRCDGTIIENTTFANTEGELTQADHSYDENGACTVCGLRYITTAAQLDALATDISSGYAATPVNVILGADIDLIDYPNFQGIGTSTNPYAGTFDGQYHRIKNLVIVDSTKTSATSKNRGLFNWLTGGTLIKNLVMDSTCSVIGYQRAAAVAGNSKGASGIIRFEQVGNEGYVSTQYINAAGIFACCGGSVKLFMTNCYNTGEINGSDQSAALTAWANSNARIVNCYNSGKISGIWVNWTLFRYWSYKASVVDNCYEIEQEIPAGTTPDPSSVEIVTMDQVENGELCYYLNGSVSGGDVFYQNLTGENKDSHPIFNPSHSKVYKNADGTYTNETVNGINGANAIILSGAKKIYTTDGVEVKALQKGINIVRENGKTTKVLVK